MSSGSNYVKAPYEAVEGRAVNTMNTAIPSGGQTVVGGVYYSWVNTESEKGFSGSGSWFTNIPDGPTGSYFGNSEEAAQNYVDEYGNLDAIFRAWSQNPEYDVDAYQNFLNAIQSGASGCASV